MRRLHFGFLMNVLTTNGSCFWIGLRARVTSLRRHPPSLSPLVVCLLHIGWDPNALTAYNACTQGSYLLLQPLPTLLIPDCLAATTVNSFWSQDLCTYRSKYLASYCSSPNITLPCLTFRICQAPICTRIAPWAVLFIALTFVVAMYLWLLCLPYFSTT